MPGLTEAKNSHGRVRLWRNNLNLTWALIGREIRSRYRGSFLGFFWSLINPLLLLAVYTFVFGTIFRARWATSTDDSSSAEYAVILFAGLIVFNLFSETLNRAPTLILQNSNYVTKVIFPLEILVPVAVGNALFHALTSIAILLPFVFLVFGHLPATALLLPLIILPLLLVILGMAWFLASLGTYIRDIGQFISTLTMATLFLAPIFFPATVMPEWARPVLMINPITIPVEQAREVLIFGNLPDFELLGAYAIASAVIAALGLLWFTKTKDGFADVL
ncbi:hypothetical protein NOR53_245 [gamma proteobacterium NOR5-3]|nr:hypothetical protein NOR53_245 [gamma proteobacterium NOR5-3]